MGRNGSCLSTIQTWIHSGAGARHDVTTKLHMGRANPHQTRWQRPVSFTSICSWTLVTFSVLSLLGHFHSAAATAAPLCPGECQCTNVTLAGDMVNMQVITIDCSNRSLHSLDGILTPTKAPTNIGTNAESISLLLDTSVNGTESLHSSNDTAHQRTKYNTTQEDTTPFVSSVNLDLSFNDLSSLQLTNLVEWEAAHLVMNLNLSNNRIEHLENASLHYLVNLVSLDLSNNHIQTFTHTAFQQLLSLQHLYLQENNIVSIRAPDKYLKTHSPLLRLDLSNNHLVELPALAFSTFSTLRRLDLSYNSITTVSHFAFAGLAKLQSLSLSYNAMASLDYPVFQNTTFLNHLDLSGLQNLTSLYFNVFEGLSHLKYLNLSQNTQLDYLSPNTLYSLNSLEVLDLSGSAIQVLSPITFQNNPQLHTVYLKDIPLTCQCSNAWLKEQMNNDHSIFQNVSSLQCKSLRDNKTVPIENAVFPCENVTIHNMTSDLSVSVGSTLMLRCQQASSSNEEILTWTTPRGRVLSFHHFHPNASQHLLSAKDVKPNSPFHKDHRWHHSSSYYSDLDSQEDRILILSDGSLFIDYVLRVDPGSYTCMIKNAYFNGSGTVAVQLRYTIANEVKMIACIVGLLSAFTFFALNLLYVMISWLARRLVNKRRREHIRQMLEGLNNYKSTQITRVYENYTSQLSRVRNRYHSQRDRLHRNYTMQVDKVKRGCSHQVEKIRENYNSKLTQLRDYSSNQIVQIRDIANTQIGRIRDYGSQQLDRVRETYKLQQQHVLKLLDTMNLDNCRSIVETECMRTESMMYDLDLLSQEDERTDSPFSIGDSEYNTAASSPMLEAGELQKADIARAESRLIEVDNLTDGDSYHDTREEEDDDDIPEAATNKTIDSNRHTGDDIQIEMNSIIQLADNVDLIAKEVWVHQKEDEKQHTLYTQLCPRDMKSSPQAYNPSPTKNIDNQNEEIIQDSQDENTMVAVTLPSIDLNCSLTPAEPMNVNLPHWKGDSADKADSPTKTKFAPKTHFPYEYEDLHTIDGVTTVNLYDADEEEDEDEEEKTERDTMV